MKPYQSGDIGYLYKTGNELNRFVVSIRSGTPSGEGSIKSWVEIKTENGSLFKSSAYVNRLRVDSDIVVWFKKVGDAYDVLLDVISAGTGSFIGGSTTSTYTATSSTINVDSLFPFDVVQLRNGAYDNFNITIDTNGVYSRNFPEYDYYTRINCNFDDNLKISDASDVLLSTRKLRIKRRIVGEFEWVLIYEVNTEDLTTFSISERDYLTPTGKRFEYALVPVLDGDIEADYITTQVDTNFSWCYLCDGDTSLKFYTNVTYPTITSSVASGLHVPIGRRFPITVYNSENDFESGTFNGDILGANFLDTRRINRAEVQAQLTIAKRFINNKKSKILKDWDGRCKLVDTNISNGMTENVDLINGKVNVSFNFVEKGEWNNQQDLYDNGIIHYSSN